MWIEAVIHTAFYKNMSSKPQLSREPPISRVASKSGKEKSKITLAYQTDLAFESK